MPGTRKLGIWWSDTKPDVRRCGYVPQFGIGGRQRFTPQQIQT